MTKLTPSEMDTSSQYYVAAWDELSIEKDLFKLFKHGRDRFKGNKIVEAQQTALREIDRLKAAGIYEVEREILRKRILYPTYSGTKFTIDPKFQAKLRTFLDCLKSPDLEVRAIFDALDKAFDIRKKNLVEMQS